MYEETLVKNFLLQLKGKGETTAGADSRSLFEGDLHQGLGDMKDVMFLNINF